MQINVAQLLKEPVGAKRNYRVDELAGENDSYHVDGEIDLTRTGNGVLVRGTLTTDINGTCDRCLGAACVQITFKIEDEYCTVVDINTGAHIQLEADALTIDHNHNLDLDEAIRQYIIIATPTKLLCRPDCPGICPICGHEFAKGDCQHRNKSIDHRLHKLLELEKEIKV